MSQLIQVLFTGLGQGGIYVLIGFGFSIVMLACKILNLAHGSYVLYGAFIFLTWTAAVGVPPVFLIPPVVLVVALAGLGTERLLNAGTSPWRQVPGYSNILRTLALLIIFEGIAFVVWGSDSHPTPPVQSGVARIGGALIAWQLLWIFVVAVVLTGAFSLFLSRTWFGLAIRASAENPLTAYLLGIDRRTVGLVAFGLAAAVGALTGTLIGPITWIDYSAAGFFMLKGTLVYLIGGEEAVAGPLAGGIFLGLTENLLLLVPGGIGGFLKEVVPLGIMILILMFRPKGLIAPRRATA